MKYNLEGTTLNLQYERKDKIWKDFLDTTRIDSGLPQPLQEARRILEEDASSQVVESANLVHVMTSIPEMLPSSGFQQFLYKMTRRKPILPSSYDTINVWYEPDPKVNFGGKRFTINNNGRSKLELMMAYLNEEDVIK